MPNQQITADRLRELLDYDRATGVFTRRVSTARRMKVGEAAGTVNSAGYVCIMLDKVTYKAHRLAWLYVNGEWPKQMIDHIDGDKANNRIENLRDVPRRINGENQKKAHKTNPNRLLGVTRDNREGVKRPFMAQIVVRGVHKTIGTFETAEAAHIAYLQKKREHHEGCTI